MKITVSPTEEFFRTHDGDPVRAWRGTTEDGTPIVAFISAIVARDENDERQLARELLRIPGPNLRAVAFP